MLDCDSKGRVWYQETEFNSQKGEFCLIFAENKLQYKNLPVRQRIIVY